MNESIEIQVRQIAADVLSIPLARISRQTSPETVAGWDSVQHLNFILALEQELNIQFDPEEIDKIRSVGDAIDVAVGK
ncbi:MAG TPA: acyl carrier protein [Tepidisphaeraceae bacterium]|jgi:acyl carrier protein|nr:acyl carrier protein [Tepidisphaeraceae bacterium]